MIHGARAALGKAGGKQDPRSRWLGNLRERRHPNVVAVALANKNARIVWAMLRQRQILRTQTIGTGGLGEAVNERINKEVSPSNCNKMANAKRSFRRFPNLVCGPAWPGQCLGAVEVEARENPSGLAATEWGAAVWKPDIRQQL